MSRNTRPISWIRAAQKGFLTFPQKVRDNMEAALTIAAEGGKADTAKPLKGLGSGIMEIALKHDTNAYRAIYVTELAGSLWVVHAFQKKSKAGIKTPKQDVDLIRQRLKRLKEAIEQ